ncbi:hypothetical protein KIPB_001072 [Kipferlia bialata]|uniref:Uncharacterized protein n=1 Tax=Kipferlia bialata TaxID=797122 RepID=A0A9K3CPK1_9EUKA|nr:hypothetical protein KIPB_001072 [Kipferlia bialata]|eukprot:g1072.t1
MDTDQLKALYKRLATSKPDAIDALTQLVDVSQDPATCKRMASLKFDCAMHKRVEALSKRLSSLREAQHLVKRSQGPGVDQKARAHIKSIEEANREKEREREAEEERLRTQRESLARAAKAARVGMLKVHRGLDETDETSGVDDAERERETLADGVEGTAGGWEAPVTAPSPAPPMTAGGEGETERERECVQTAPPDLEVSPPGTVSDTSDTQGQGQGGGGVGKARGVGGEAITMLPVTTGSPSASPSQRKSKGRRSKTKLRPAWALTSELNEEREEEGVDDLLDWADSMAPVPEDAASADGTHADTDAHDVAQALGADLLGVLQGIKDRIDKSMSKKQAARLAHALALAQEHINRGDNPFAEDDSARCLSPSLGSLPASGEGGEILFRLVMQQLMGAERERDTVPAEREKERERAGEIGRLRRVLKTHSSASLRALFARMAKSFGLTPEQGERQALLAGIAFSGGHTASVSRDGHTKEEDSKSVPLHKLAYLYRNEAL